MKWWILLALPWAFAAGSSPPQAHQADAYNRGVEAYQRKDFATALASWSEAAGRGDINAMNNAGFLLYNGLGGSTDVDAAVALWSAAATMGQAESQWHLGKAYEEGKGLDRDPVKALGWYQCAEDTARRMIANGEHVDVKKMIQADAHSSAEALAPKLDGNGAQQATAFAARCVDRYGSGLP